MHPITIQTYLYLVNTTTKPPFLTNSFQLHIICNYVATDIFLINKQNNCNYQLSQLIYLVGL
jgi:hypothetical protein